ncbi:MAG: hypothetical protein GF317_08640 [Candidatus Lokiarchaeota archaeon]|nr:hypothetical protein [Candidatus Lokiarchaeota archaeon]MBD3199782.1 hypothetical protein [Candidatus Lokiarchaeota archaeon]
MLLNLFQDASFSFFSFFDSIELGLYFVIIGYYFLIFAYFMVMRFRISKKLYWFFFSILFLALAASRLFFIITDFYIPELQGSVSSEQIVGLLMINYRFATFCTWMATTFLMGVLGILLFPPDSTLENQEIDKDSHFIIVFIKENETYVRYFLRICLFIFPLIIGILALTLPDTLIMDPSIPGDYSYSIDLQLIEIAGWSYPVGRFVLNFILQPLFVAIVPFIYSYLAWKTFGVLRRSYGLNALGFFIYYVGRITQGLFEVLNWPHIQAIVPPLLILLALLLIVIANSFETLK